MKVCLKNKRCYPGVLSFYYTKVFLREILWEYVWVNFVKKNKVFVLKLKYLEFKWSSEKSGKSSSNQDNFSRVFGIPSLYDNSDQYASRNKRGRAYVYDLDTEASDSGGSGTFVDKQIMKKKFFTFLTHSLESNLRMGVLMRIHEAGFSEVYTIHDSYSFPPNAAESFINAYLDELCDLGSYLEVNFPGCLEISKKHFSSVEVKCAKAQYTCDFLPGSLTAEKHVQLFEEIRSTISRDDVGVSSRFVKPSSLFCFLKVLKPMLFFV